MLKNYHKVKVLEKHSVSFEPCNQKKYVRFLTNQTNCKQRRKSQFYLKALQNRAPKINRNSALFGTKVLRFSRTIIKRGAQFKSMVWVFNVGVRR